MGNYIEYKDTIAFHPGYYIKEIIDASGLTQQEFAVNLDTTPKNLSVIVRGEQSLSPEMARKLSNMLGTSIQYWLNLQSAYDAVVQRIEDEKNIVLDKEILKIIGYDYFEKKFQLPQLSRKVDQQVIKVREFLKIATLKVLAKEDYAVSFRCTESELTKSIHIRANVMMQIAINEAAEIESPIYNEKKFKEAIQIALRETSNHSGFLDIITEAFRQAGVIFVVLPQLPSSKVYGATKKIGSRVLLMVSDRGTYADVFWFTLFHEIGHILNNDFGLSLACDKGNKEKVVDMYARDILIPKKEYTEFITTIPLTPSHIKQFAKEVNRDPGLVVGRLLHDSKVDYLDKRFTNLRTKYKVVANS